MIVCSDTSPILCCCLRSVFSASWRGCHLGEHREQRERMQKRHGGATPGFPPNKWDRRLGRTCGEPPASAGELCAAVLTSAAGTTQAEGIAFWPLAPPARHARRRSPPSARRRESCKPNPHRQIATGGRHNKPQGHCSGAQRARHPDASRSCGWRGDPRVPATGALY